MITRIWSLLFQSSFIKQFIKFGIVGLSNTALSYVLYLIFLHLFERNHIFLNYDYLASSVFIFCICIVWSFYWNNRFTFNRDGTQKGDLVRSFMKASISYTFTGLFLHNLLLYVFVECVGISKIIAPLINLVVTVPLNFLLNKYWAFSGGRKRDQ